MQTGIYEQIINLLLKRNLEAISSQQILTEVLDSTDSHDYLSQYIHRVLAQYLSKVKPEHGLKSDAERAASRLQKQILICNEVIDAIQNSGLDNLEDAKISEEAKRLLAVLDSATLTPKAPPRPDAPLVFGALLTGTRQDPSFVSQLSKEIFTANRIDILCSFIKWSGIRIIEPALRLFTSRDNVSLRVITTSYLGATDLKAIQFLATLQNTEIKVSYDTHRTRLHAKAYLIHRETGFSSAYVGSSNISQAALTDGLEWNIKISQYEQPFMWNKISATFETYWNDNEFETFSGQEDEKRLQHALKQESQCLSNDEINIPFFELRPYTFQQEILDRIAVEREFQDRKKHLIVAATGTGKTMIAAFDYKRWRQQMSLKREPRFLYVAHREEILRQSLYTFRAVLRNRNFGDLLVGGNTPEQIDQLFTSIQSYNSLNLSQRLSNGHYEYVVIDEFHHAAAPSYKSLLAAIDPVSLLGLTATPERMDGLDIKHYFDDHISAEIRLPDAINRKLLAPFQYFGITDNVDYSGLRWQRGGYLRSDLDRILTGNDDRAALVIQKVVQTVLDTKQARGLCFCVSQAHAEYMSRKFNESGISSDFLTAQSTNDHRRKVQSRLVNREINFIFVVDLYNEGVDIPEIDTVLFLRPTESLTIFLQQFGRGLRLFDGKDCLTVIDFVGQSHKKYRFDSRFNALLTDRKYQVSDELLAGFPHLPAGCTIQLEKQAQQYILDNIRASIVQSKPQLVQNISSFTADTGFPLTMQNFIEYYEIEIDDIYRRGSWARLCVDAGVRDNFFETDEDRLTKGIRRIHHVNDVRYIDHLLAILKSHGIENSSFLSPLDEKYLLMLHFTLWGNKYIPETIQESLLRLDRNPVMKSELIDLLKLRREKAGSVPPVLSLPFDCPMHLHAQYTRDEILAALGYWTLKSQPAMREGVLFLTELNLDIFFITLNKSEKHYSPTTMYEDYAISETLFHWQSQSTTSEKSRTGQRYINHKPNGQSVMLFVREDRFNKSNLSEPYHFLGPAEYISHTGSCPMSITWRLHYRIPACLLRQTTRLVVG